MCESRGVEGTKEGGAEGTACWRPVNAVRLSHTTHSAVRPAAGRPLPPQLPIGHTPAIWCVYEDAFEDCVGARQGGDIGQQTAMQQYGHTAASSASPLAVRLPVLV